MGLHLRWQMTMGNRDLLFSYVRGTPLRTMWCVVYHWHDWVQYTKDPIYTNSEFVLKRESESWKPIIPHDCGIVYRCYSWLNSDNIIKHHDKLPSFEISLTFLAPQTVGLHGAMCEGLKGWISSQRKNLSWFVTFFCHWYGQRCWFCGE